MASLYRLCNYVLTKYSSSKPVVKEFNLFSIAATYAASNNLDFKRGMSRVKHRKTHPSMKWTKKRIERHDQEVTAENQDFVNQVILETKGPTYTPFSNGMPCSSPLKQAIKERGEWTPKSIRTGVIARKIGVHPMWSKSGKKLYATLLQVVDNHVIRYLSPEDCQRNYGRRFGNLGMLIVGAESADPQLFTKDYCGLFTECGTLPKLKLNRFTITPDAALQPGTPLYASHFQVGQRVDISGYTIERGFQGVMARWKFKGNRATHGVTKSHRRPGNIGGGGEKGRVWAGTRLPGHMGGARRTSFGIEVLRINTKYNVIYVKSSGCVGDTNKFVTIRDTFLPRRRFTEAPPFPTFYPEEAGEMLPEDIFEGKVHTFSEPTVFFDEKR